MTYRTTKKQTRLRAWLAALGTFVAAATFGALVASVISFAEPRVKAPLQNPFDASRTIQ